MIMMVIKEFQGETLGGGTFSVCLIIRKPIRRYLEH